MKKKLTISLDQQVYDTLHAVIGQHNISQFIETLVRSHVIGPELEAAYQQMADDEQREADAEEWSEATIGDVADEPR